MNKTITWPAISEIAQAVQSQEITAESQVQKSLDLIKKHQDYKAIISVLSDRALAQARDIDYKIKNNKQVGSLAGVPFIAKDNFLIASTMTTAASKMLKNFKAPYSATAIKRLEEAGAICVAKANLDAFAHGASTENSDFFVTLNPNDKNRVAGGSSGGSAASVKLGLVPFALGTDTGGSIRQPAGFCGVVGLKPSYGRVSRHGVVAMASSLDCIGPITTTIQDAETVMRVIAGVDQYDSTTLDLDFQPQPTIDLKNIKVGVISEYLNSSASPAVNQAIEQLISKLKKTKLTVDKVSLPSLELSLASYYIICPAEVSSNLARYDGIRYGYQADNCPDLQTEYRLSRGNGFGFEAKRRIMLGTYVLSSGYYDAYYKKAQMLRTKLIQEFNQAFKSYDILIGPVSPTTAFKIGEKNLDPMSMYLSDIMTVAANLVGVPAISLPIATDSAGLPIALQVLADYKADEKLLAISEQIIGINNS